MSNTELIIKIRQNIHDINNQLTVLKGKADKVLSKDDENEDLKKIVEKTDRIIQLVAETRSFVIEIK